MITQTSRYSVEPCSDKDGEAASELIRDGAKTGTIVPGRVLEAAYAIDDRALIFLTHDIPYEEQLEILLLDASDSVIDRAAVYGAYATGSFKALGVGDDDSVGFQFFAGQLWAARILEKTRFSLPFAEPRGVHRETRWRGFVIERF